MLKKDYSKKRLFKNKRSLSEYFREKKNKTKSLQSFKTLLLSPRCGQAGADGAARNGRAEPALPGERDPERSFRRGGEGGVGAAACA